MVKKGTTTFKVEKVDSLINIYICMYVCIHKVFHKEQFFIDYHRSVKILSFDVLRLDYDVEMWLQHPDRKPIFSTSTIPRYYKLV